MDGSLYLYIVTNFEDFHDKYLKLTLFFMNFFNKKINEENSKLREVRKNMN